VLRDPQCRVNIEQRCQRRIRSTDTAGWLADDELGIILPDTAYSDAWALVRALQLLLHDVAPRLVIDVQVYPSFDLDGEKSSQKPVPSPHRDVGAVDADQLAANRSSGKWLGDDRKLARR